MLVSFCLCFCLAGSGCPSGTRVPAPRGISPHYGCPQTPKINRVIWPFFKFDRIPLSLETTTSGLEIEDGHRYKLYVKPAD